MGWIRLRIRGCRCWRRRFLIRSWLRWHLWRFCLRCYLNRFLSHRLIIRNRQLWSVRRSGWWIIRLRGCFIIRWWVLGPWRRGLDRPWFPFGLRRWWLACTWQVCLVSAFRGRIRSWPFHSLIRPCSIIILRRRLLSSTWRVRRWRPWWRRWRRLIRWSSCHRRPWRRCFRHWRLQLIRLSRRRGLQRRLSRLRLRLKILRQILIRLRWRPFWLIRRSRCFRIIRYRHRLNLRNLHDQHLRFSCCFISQLIIRLISRWSGW